MSGLDTAAGLETTGRAPEGEAARADLPSPLVAGPERKRRWMPYWTGFVGFVLGVLFWHFVGFWSFVSEVAFNGDEVKSPSRLINLETARSVRASEHAAAEARVAAAPQPSKPPVAAAAPADTGSTEAGDGDVLSDLLQCTEVRPLRGEGDVDVHACPPLRQRLARSSSAQRGDRMMDAREAADRLANGWQTGVSRIETGSLQTGR